jgi:hypothetical protein
MEGANDTIGCVVAIVVYAVVFVFSGNTFIGKYPQEATGG